MAKTEKTARDIQQEVTDAIVAQLEAGTRPWSQPWRGGGMVPVNGMTGKPYRGANVLVLWGAMLCAGYADSRWLTYKQAAEMGGQVRKGEKGTQIVKWLSFTLKAKDGEPEPEEPGKVRLTARAYTVFNVAQIDGLPAVEAGPQLTEADQIGDAEAFFAAVEHKYQPNGPAAYYTPATDTVTMPAFASFEQPLRFYDVRAHEMGHWTGAASRLARPMNCNKGSDEYAFEELVAELTAAFVMAQLGLSSEPRPDHASYLESWLKRLRSDKRYIFSAASKAQAAADFLFKQAETGGFAHVEQAEEEDGEPLAHAA